MHLNYLNRSFQRSIYPFAWLLFCVFISFNAFSQNSTRLLNTETWRFHKTKESKWYPATVPGTVHTDLFKNNLIPDPFFGDNEKQLQWIENEDWEYKTMFFVSNKELANPHIELECDGLDTYATVYLNDSIILRADNMFRSWNKEIKPYLKAGKNELRIVFESAVKKGKETAAKLPYTLPGDEKVFTRKAQYQYGWDFGPRFVTCGIWKNISLHFWDKVKILDVSCTQKTLTDSLAHLSFTVLMDVAVPGIYESAISSPDITKGSEEIDFPRRNCLLEKGIHELTIDCTIKNPKRWWSNGLGEANLYHFKVALCRKSGTAFDEKEITIGLRTIELVQEKDKAGSSFYFKLNGVPVFMKGANYIPADNFLPRISPESYKTLIKEAKEAHMNMLRVWGGGVYADDEFYNECDRNGILVWQDLMFACAMYPGDTAFIENVTREVKDNATRLKHHPCIALWCGNNEIDEGWKNWGWQKQYHYSAKDSAEIWNNYTNLFHKVIPQTLRSSSENIIYWPSSPSIGWGRKESLLQGDAHYWGVWWGMEPFDMYEKKVGRFMSEYGFQSIPDLSTLKTIATPQDLNLSSDAMKNHQKHATGYETIKTYMARDYTVPENFEDFIYVSQLTQALGMKMAIEAHRRAKPYCMGTLYWQLNDCWPGTTWSSLDYYNKPKALYYEVKRAFNDVIISFEQKNDSLYVYVVSDKQQDLSGNLSVQLMDMAGKDLLEETKQITVKTNGSSIKLRYALKQFLNETPAGNCVFHVEFKSDFSSIASANYFFVKPKELLLSKPSFSTKIDVKTGLLEISSSVFAKDVWIDSNQLELSDNFFDLLPGEKKIIRITQKKGSGILKPLIIKSLFNVK
jgi:beta-mannosidase